MFITNGPVADVAVVYAKTDPEAGNKGVSAFIVEKGSPGFSTGKVLKKMGVRGSPTSELIFEDCEIPTENLLGEENQGIRVLMSGLDRERILYSIAPIGMAQGAFDLAFKYASERVQFGAPIISFQMMQELLADIATDIQAGRVLSYWAAVMAESGYTGSGLHKTFGYMTGRSTTQNSGLDVSILHSRRLIRWLNRTFR